MLKSIKLDNVPQSFAKIDPDGKYVLYEHLPYYADIISSHIQGFTKVYVNGEEYSLLTHDSNITKYGWIIRKLKPTAEEYKERRTPSKLQHPAGMQAIGQYVFVACEYKPRSSVLIYDVSQEDLPVISVKNFGHAASSCGITDFEYNGKTRYILVVNSNPECHFYISEDSETTDITEINFVKLGELNLKTHSKGEKDDFEGIGLVTDQKNNVFLIALFSRGDHLTYGDFAMLLGIEINISDQNNSIKGVHYETKHLTSRGSIAGVDGVHFRWGTGVYVSEQEGLCIVATSRNILSRAGNKLDTNIWAERPKPSAV